MGNDNGMTDLGVTPAPHGGSAAAASLSREEWQPIETVPKGGVTNREWVVLASFHQPTDEDGDPDGPPIRIWQHVGTWFCDGWKTLSDGFDGIGPNAWMRLRDNPTHWMALPEPPE